MSLETRRKIYRLSLLWNAMAIGTLIPLALTPQAPNALRVLSVIALALGGKASAILLCWPVRKQAPPAPPPPEPAGRVNALEAVLSILESKIPTPAQAFWNQTHRDVIAVAEKCAAAIAACESGFGTILVPLSSVDEKLAARHVVEVLKRRGWQAWLAQPGVIEIRRW